MSSLPLSPKKTTAYNLVSHIYHIMKRNSYHDSAVLQDMKSVAAFQKCGCNCTKDCKKYMEKSAIAMANMIFRSLSLFDLLTDVRLLYLSSEAQFLPLTVSLFLTILLPYILSYSVGIRIRFIHGIDGRNENGMVGHSSVLAANYGNNNGMGLRALLNYLLILPFGILYYVFLDVLDLVFVYYKGYCSIVMNDDEQRQVLLQEILANQCGLGNRMNYEGVKRQRSIGSVSYSDVSSISNWYIYI